MAKVTLAPFIKDIRGKVGNTVFRRSHNGKLIAFKMPDMSNVKWSKAQKAHRQRFKKAVAYAKAAMAEAKGARQIPKSRCQSRQTPLWSGGL